MIFELHFFLLSVEIVEGASIIQECIRSNGADYRGGHRTTTIGTECVNWMDAARQHNLTDYRDTQSGVGDHNYCRNPDASDRPWCYVLYENGTTQRQDCDISICKDYTSAENPPASSRGDEEVFELVPSVPAQSDNAAVQPVVGISQRVQTGPKKKKDLGTLGYVLGILMITIIILLGVGITFGYLYKRGRDLQQQREQRAYEREMQRITLPLSAFSNPACELAEENTVIVITGDQQTPCQEGVGAEGGTPLIGQAGTPGA